MNENEQLQLFEDQAIRTAWDEENEEWYFSVVDVVSVLTDAKDYDTARNYWKVTKKRLKDEGSKLVTDCNQLKLKSPKDGKRYKTDVANTQQLFRIIQSIPSPKAEPMKLWLAQVGRERIEETLARNALRNAWFLPMNGKGTRGNGSISACRQFRPARN